MSYIVKGVCQAIAKHLSQLYLRLKTAADELIARTGEFESRWQFLSALGAIDGKHVVIRQPKFVVRITTTISALIR